MDNSKTSPERRQFQHILRPTVIGTFFFSGGGHDGGARPEEMRDLKLGDIIGDGHSLEMKMPRATNLAPQNAGVCLLGII